MKTALQGIKQFALIQLLVTLAVVPVVVAVTGAVLWIGSGSPWAGPTVIGILALIAAAGVWIARPWEWRS